MSVPIGTAASGGTRITPPVLVLIFVPTARESLDVRQDLFASSGVGVCATLTFDHVPADAEIHG
jgi:hypothetical protein